MTKKRKSRLYLIILLIIGVSVSAGLALKAFNENVMFYFSPTDIKDGKAPIGHKFRAGGLVVAGSVKRDGTKVQFVVTDNKENFTIEFDGILPDLFREGQGIIALGKLDSNGMMIADQVLAKHDENYMPPEVQDSLHK
ncbi:MAG: cytochrome c maturation protein CcmE [Gammaproteobacteria bacterium]|nr:MAG: cytochrome c maturation protein CcmE [Gammaproteobacteria bacterium]